MVSSEFHNASGRARQELTAVLVVDSSDDKLVLKVLDSWPAAVYVTANTH